MRDLFEFLSGFPPHPSRIALSQRQRDGAFAETTYEQLWERMHRVAEVLGSPTETPSFVVILAGKSADSVACMLAAMVTGHAFCAPNPKYRGPQIAAVLEATRARLCAVDATGLLALRGAIREHPSIAQTCWLLLDADRLNGPAVEVAAELRAAAPVLDLRNARPAVNSARPPRGYTDPQAPATCLFTSGSTGRPKGVLISADDLRRRAAAEVECFELSDRDVLLNIVSLSYDLGFNQLLTALTVGAELVLLDSWLPADILNAVEQRRVTGISAVPVIWQDMLRSGLRFDRAGRHRSLRYITLSGGDLSQPQRERLPAVVDGAGIFKTYGQQEAFRATALRPADYMHKLDSVGTPFPGVRVYVARDDGTRCRPSEAGEIVHAGVGVMLGYLGARGEIEKGEKLRPNPFYGPDDPSPHALFTGDTGYLDADGYLYVKGRRDSMVKILGNRVYPQEVTSQLLNLPGIHDAVVLGMPRADGQTVLVAFVAPAAHVSLKPTTIRKLLSTKLPTFMIPKEFVFLDRIPRTETGKTDPRALAANYAPGMLQSCT